MSDGMLDLLFLQRPGHRERQRDTMRAVPAGVRARSTLTAVDAVDERTTFLRSISFRGRLKSVLARALVPIHVRRVPAAFRRDDALLYTWGAIPAGTRQRYIVECDTPYVLSMYGVTWFRIVRPLLSRLLGASRCVGVVCVSEACRTALLRELGGQLADKVHVVYPVPPPVHGAPAARDASAPLRVLFVSTQFVLKGGRELLAAVRSLVGQGAAIELTMVTDVEAAAMYARPDDTFVRLVPANVPREELRRDYFGQAHVLVHPTFQDSFGMVLLEGLAAGLPIIATDLFAADEMVVGGANGSLVEPPVRYYARDKRAVWRNWGIDLERTLRQREFPDFAAALARAITPMLDEPTRSACAARSRRLFAERFALPVREAAFARAVGMHPAAEDAVCVA
jgi:glycosyltransferase involved in cell wall biosynthesis